MKTMLTLALLLLTSLPVWAQTAQVELTGYGYLEAQGVREADPDEVYVERADSTEVIQTTDTIVIQGETRFGIKVFIHADEGETVQCTDRLIYPKRQPDGSVQVIDEPLPELFTGPFNKTSYYTVATGSPIPEGDYTFIYDCGENLVQRTLHVRYPK